MSDTAPLAALLASHPEECAAVVAVLAAAEWDCPGGISVSRIRELTNTQDDGERLLSILRAVVAAGLAQVNAWCEYRVGNEAVAVAIARMGAAAWLREQCGTGPREARYADRDAISARVAAVLGCRVDRVGLAWESSRLGRIEVGNRGLDGDDVAALIKAGFEPSILGWDVPGDCGGGAEEQPK